jgi:hypothetical protein
VSSKHVKIAGWSTPDNPFFPLGFPAALADTKQAKEDTLPWTEAGMHQLYSA